jgi:hypothetical protein
LSKKPAPGNSLHRPDFSKSLDCLLLFAIVLIASLPYLSGLGFHSDDWSYQAELSHSSSQQLGKVLLQEWQADWHFAARPVMVLYMVVSFRAFGSHDMPYQVAISLMLALTVVLLYLTLCELWGKRWLSLSIALMFGLLPHYSTDRFWWASHQAIFCMGFAFLGILALSRSFRREESHRTKWLVVAVLSSLASVLSYEVALGMIVAGLAMIGWREFARNRGSHAHRFASMAWLSVPVAVLFVVGMVKALSQERLLVHRKIPTFLTHFGELSRKAIIQGVQFCFWNYGIRMPAVLIALYRHSAIGLGAVAVSIIVAVLVAAYLWKYMEAPVLTSWQECLQLIGAGFILFALGYALFFRDPKSNFYTAGINNRVAIASALGATFVAVAVLGLACSWFKSDRVRIRVFSILMGLVCAANCLVVNGIAHFWAIASSEQKDVLSSVATNLHALPHGSTLLLDGFCRFSGPGVVFETDWDTTGAVQLTLNDYSLLSDVVSPNTHFLDSDVETTVYELPEAKYPYSDHLYVYNVRARHLAPLRSSQAAYSYLHAFNPTGDSGCRAGQEGDGTKIF